MAEPARIRIRLVFADRHLLSKDQRSDGLRRCWLLVGPEIATIGELASVVYRRFNLRHTCPDGVFFTMDGFVLPSFESTCIFLDKDLVSVHKISKKKKTITGGNDKLPTEILAIESREDNERYNLNSDDEGIATQNETVGLLDKKSKRKLKDLEKPECSKKEKKKPKLTTPEKPLVIQETNENVNEEQNQDSENNGNTHEDRNQDLEMTARTSDDDGERSSPVVATESSPSVLPERDNQLEVSSDENRTELDASEATQKLASRSSRRRKAQRTFRTEMKKLEREKMLSGLLANGTHTEIPSTSNHPTIAEKPSVVVPVLVRPGYIRFESDDDDEGPSNKQLNVAANRQENDPAENFQWNGITNKAKGQKWGQGSKRKNDSTNESNWTSSNWQNETNEINITTKEKNTTEKGKVSADHPNFESLSPLTCAPKEGDIIVYRVVELSPTLCPELSSLRVGEVKIYDSISNRIILAPVPEFPIFPEKNENDENEDGAPNLEELSLYKEDGSLEIEFGALLDLRLLKDNNTESASASSLNRKSKNRSREINSTNTNWNQSNSNQQNDWEKTAAKNNSDDSGNPQTGNEETRTEQNGWDKWAPNTSTPSWSYHALRGSALGPTIAWLRGNDNNNNNSTRENCGGRGRGRRGRGRRGRGRPY